MKAAKTAATTGANVSFEERMQRLEDIVTALGDAALPLEKSVALYKEGVNLAAACRTQLQKAQHEMLLCTEKGMVPFDVDATKRNDGQTQEEDI